MGRRKTISDEDVLGIARNLFRARGHAVTTRQIAEAAGISEAILYQRFVSKDDLFFAAMHPRGPDIEELLGPKEPVGDARTYIQEVVVRFGKYFAGVLPLALRVMTHPSFDPSSLARAQPNAGAVLREGLAKRLATLMQKKRIVTQPEVITARLLVSLAHDWALGKVLSPNSSQRDQDLKAMVDVVWEGLRVK
jgi:AcrR family transcriptional regulator